MALEVRPEVASRRDDTGAVGTVDAPRRVAGSMSWIQLPTVTSPMFKQVFDLRIGRCLDDPDVTVPAYGVEGIDDQVVVTIGGGDQAGSGDE